MLFLMHMNGNNELNWNIFQLSHRWYLDHRNLFYLDQKIG